MEMRGILVFILCGISAIAALTGKGYYCRDPDTGYLYPANSTWQSTTFCGNYSCKLRKRNPGDGITLLRTINVTYVNNTETIQAKSAANENVTLNIKKDKPHVTLPLDSPELAILKSLLPMGHLDFSKLKIQDRLKHNPSQNQETENNDRFLTDNEIKTISELLHNVKKSDLEAIVDIYSLAQDIYKEMDKVSSENIVEETIRSANVVNEKPISKKISYWYEPTYRLSKTEGKMDMEHQGSNMVSSTVQPQNPGYPNTYFGGALNKEDFGKLPYYYPLSSFQRQSSYIHPLHSSTDYFHPPLSPSNPQTLPPTNPQPFPPTIKPPCKSQINNINNNVPPVIQSQYPFPYSYMNPPQNYGGVIKKPFTVEAQRQIAPSNLLPYPFSYVQPYNMSYPSYFSDPWARFDISNNHNQKSFYKSQLTQVQSNSIPANFDKADSGLITDVEQKNTESEKLLDKLIVNTKILSNSKPEWQTDPIPTHILNEVRAHFEEKAKLLKPFSLRKKVKLERVGKLVKLDELHREKRSVDDEEESPAASDVNAEMETYIEKTTCLSDIDPGYFRMGNISEPYPACCPQRITENPIKSD